MIYQVITEDYECVSVKKTSIFNYLKMFGALDGDRFFDNDDELAITEDSLMKKIKSERSFYIYEEGGSDWEMKINLQSKLR